MNKTKNEVEKELTRIIAEQESVYSEINMIMDQAKKALAAGTDSDKFLSVVTEKLVDVANRESELRQLKDLWNRRRFEPSQQLESRIADLTAVVEDLLASSQQLEEELRGASQRLRPEINRNVVATKMHRAYWKAPRPTG